MTTRTRELSGSSGRDDMVQPPRTSIGVLGWLRKNLFSSWFNSLLTLVSLWLIVSVGGQIVQWIVTSARWDVITANLRLFMVGPYPPDQVWRVWLVVLIVSLLLGLSAGVWGSTLRTFGVWLGGALAVLALFPVAFQDRLWLVGNLAVLGGAYWLARGHAAWGHRVIVLWLAGFFAAMLILLGFSSSLPAWLARTLPEVGTNLWGGLLLTFILAVVSTVLSFPLGILLALGRRSRLPAIKLFCILYIELVRGVPLVTILFMTQIMVPLFLPSQLRLDSVLRAIVGFTLFTAAYMAENVRGGLQAIPTGQIEAGLALGLNNALVTLLIVLPQALRMVIPTTVGLFISLFKDTTLVVIVGLLDLLGIGRTVLAQPEFLGRAIEVYIFVAAIFFIFSYAMSFASYRIEAALGVGKR